MESQYDAGDEDPELSTKYLSLLLRLFQCRNHLIATQVQVELLALKKEVIIAFFNAHLNYLQKYNIIIK